MAYSAEVVQRARARLAQAKEDRESENRQHLAQAYAQVPRIHSPPSAPFHGLEYPRLCNRRHSPF